LLRRCFALCSATNAYAQAYHQIKPDKHLRWLSGLGTVEVTLELADRTIEAEVTPLQAAVVELFGQQGAQRPRL
jgi:anaphase-promoting complex subunit 2